MSLRQCASIFCLMAAAIVSSVFAQVDTATITGRVTDSTGAVIGGVQIKIANKETNFQYSAVTNTDGIYRVQSLQAGTYQVAFEASVVSTN